MTNYPRIALIFAASLSLVACATAPKPDPWASAAIPEKAATRPHKPPEWPAPAETTADLACFDLEGARALEAWRIAGQSNFRIAGAHADQVDELRRASRALVEAGRETWRLAELRSERLEDERRAFMFERVGYWALLLGFGLAAL